MAGLRPGEATAAAIFTAAGGMLTAISGTIALGYAADLGAPAAPGWIAVVVGVLTLVGGFTLFTGNATVRIVVTGLLALNLVAAVYVVLGTGWVTATGIIAVLTTALSFVLLYRGAVNTWFRP